MGDLAKAGAKAVAKKVIEIGMMQMQSLKFLSVGLALILLYTNIYLIEKNYFQIFIFFFKTLDQVR